jgi:Icc-related predicted phosphoesterase
MRILTVSDRVEKSFLKEHFLREKCEGVRLILACGDLPSYYLEYLLNSLNVPLNYVPGNHDEELHLEKKPFASGCKNIDEKVIAFEGLLVGGLGGGFRYRQGKYLYTEKQMQRKVRRMIPPMALKKIKYKRYLDILITHAPPFGIHDKQTLAHQGFETFLKFMRTYKPAYIIHGHTRPDREKKKAVSQYLSTTIINTNNYRVLDLDDASVR